MPNRIIVITGATDGLGRALASELADQPDTTLVLHGRDRSRLEELSASLADSAADVHPFLADFAELAQVHRLADEIAGFTDTVSVLVNNAGIGSGEPEGTERRVSADGYELRFAVNYLASFALTQRLLPLLEAGAPARIVHVASLGQAPIDFDDPDIERGYSGLRAYGQSKLAMITSGFTLAEKLGPARVTVNSLHPATYMPTKMVLLNRGSSIDSLETGLAATRRLVEASEMAGVTGEFFDRTRRARADESAYDPQVRQRLWDLSERRTER
jgi:NAD(P)-dependent dehydrogenase (short-subunit alcohol dehydrogenase family)